MTKETDINNHIPDFYLGSPVEPKDLRYRDEFIDQLWSSIVKRHVLLTAPRRTGKTSVMDHLEAFPRYNYLIIKENVQDFNHPADLFIALLDKFYDKHPRFFRDKLAKGWNWINKALNKVEKIDILEFKIALRESDPKWRENWRQHGEKLLSQLRNHGDKILIIIDELPDMLINLKKKDKQLLREFMAWFRTHRQQPNPKNDTVRWFLGGSVNLSGTLDSLGMVDLINDLDDIPLPTLSDKQVCDFISTMLIMRDVQLDEAVPKRCLQLLGRPIPLFMEMLTHDLKRSWERRLESRYALEAEDVDAVFVELIRSSAAQDKLQHYYSRLGKYYESPLLSAVHSILSQLSLSKNSLSRSAMNDEFTRHLEESGEHLPRYEAKKKFHQLMRDLENDFYIEEVEENRFDFASGVLKTWWRKYYA